MTRLPEEFVCRMKDLLGSEYEDFTHIFGQQRRHGLRVNTFKISSAHLREMVPFYLEPLPWIEDGFYYQEKDAVSRHPFYHAGLYYLQEPCAMTPASLLPVSPGERVMDLCAAPGGKATALGAKLRGSGLLVANDFSSSRVRALLKNIEMAGIANSLILNEVPSLLAERMPGFFDKIILDAPCSGEGMFRKNPTALRQWDPEKSAQCAAIQKSLIVDAAKMLRPGGLMMYSTCTFSAQENEDVIAHLLAECPDMHPEKLPMRDGFARGYARGVFSEAEREGMVRLWPHRIGGEGHFLALLRKDGEAPSGPESRLEDIREDRQEEEQKNSCSRGCENERGREKNRRRARKNSIKGSAGSAGAEGLSGQDRDFFHAFCQSIGLSDPGAWLAQRFPNHTPSVRSGELNLALSCVTQSDGLQIGGLQSDALQISGSNISGSQIDISRICGSRPGRIIRNGVYAGSFKKDRFEPSQSLAMVLDPADIPGAVIDLAPDNPLLSRYLRGEAIDASRLPEEMVRTKGWKLICTCGYPLGWGKLAGNWLKNHYHSAWRQT